MVDSPLGLPETPDSCPCLAARLERAEAALAEAQKLNEAMGNALGLFTKLRDQRAAQHVDDLEAAYFRGTEAGLDAARLEEHQAELAESRDRVRQLSSAIAEAISDCGCYGEDGDDGPCLGCAGLRAALPDWREHLSEPDPNCCPSCDAFTNGEGLCGECAEDVIAVQEAVAEQGSEPPKPWEEVKKQLELDHTHRWFDITTYADAGDWIRRLKCGECGEVTTEPLDAPAPAQPALGQCHCDWWGWDGDSAQCSGRPVETVGSRPLCAEHARYVREDWKPRSAPAPAQPAGLSDEDQYALRAAREDTFVQSYGACRDCRRFRGCVEEQCWECWAKSPGAGVRETAEACLKLIDDERLIPLYGPLTKQDEQINRALNSIAAAIRTRFLGTAAVKQTEVKP